MFFLAFIVFVLIVWNFYQQWKINELEDELLQLKYPVRPPATLPQRVETTATAAASTDSKTSAAQPLPDYLQVPKQSSWAVNDFAPAAQKKVDKLKETITPFFVPTAESPSTPFADETVLKEFQEETRSDESAELWVGRKLLAWLAAGCLVASAFLLIRYAYVTGLITPWMVVNAVAVFAFALLGIGAYFYRAGMRRFATPLSSVAIVTFFLDGYAAFNYYHLIDSFTANILMPLTVFGGFALAWVYRSKLLGSVAILGGLAVPVLLATPQPNYPQFLFYLILLNIGALLLVNLLRRAPLAFIAFFGTQFLFMSECHRYEMWYALVFQGIFYLIYLLDTHIAAILPVTKKVFPTWDDAVRAILAPIFLFAWIHYYLYNDKFLSSYLGMFALTGTVVYALFAVAYSRWLDKHRSSVDEPKEDGALIPSFTAFSYWKEAPAAATIISLGFLAVAIPLQFEARWCAVSWFTVFAGLWFAGQLKKSMPFTVMAYVFFALGILRLPVDVGQLYNRLADDAWLVLNTETLPLLAVSLLLPAVALSVKHIVFCKTEVSSAVKNLNDFFALVGIIVLPLVFSIDWIHFARNSLQLSPSESFSTLTYFWTGYSVLFIVPGFLLHKKNLRLIGLVFLFITLLKTTFGDLFDGSVVLMLTAAIPALLIAVWTRKTETTDAQERQGWLIAGALALFLVWLHSSMRWFDYFEGQTSLENHRTVALLAVSFWWTLFAAVLLGTGFAAKSSMLRWTALTLFIATLAKFFFVDMAGVDSIYKILAVFILGIVLAVTAWAYQRLRVK